MLQSLYPRIYNPPPRLVLQDRPPIDDVRRYGARLTMQMISAMGDYLNHRNRDGGYFHPTIVETSMRWEGGRPFYFVLVVDPQSLYHFKTSDLMGEGMLAAMSRAVGRPVYCFKQAVPSPHVQIGWVYSVQLQNTRRLTAPTAVFPKSVDFDLAQLEDTRGQLMVPLGLSVRGRPVSQKIGEGGLQHVMLVGKSGHGKSMLLQAAFAGLLRLNSPAQVRVAFIDLKGNEFSFWKDVPHRWGDVANDVDTAETLLGKVESEVSRRGALMGQQRRRSIESYNAIVPEKERLPYLIVVIDECLQLVQAAGAHSEVNRMIIAITSGGRSAGVFLWAGTQYATAAEGLSRVVTTGVKKLIFHMSDVAGARQAGCPAAASIPASAKGRCYLVDDDAAGVPLQLQGFYLSDDAIDAAAQRIAGKRPDTAVDVGKDELDPLDSATRTLLMWAVEQGKGYLSIEAVQAARRIGPSAARRVAAQLEADGWLVQDVTAANKRKVSQRGLDALQANKPTNPTIPTNPVKPARKPLPERLTEIQDVVLIERLRIELDKPENRRFSPQEVWANLRAQMESDTSSSTIWTSIRNR